MRSGRFGVGSEQLRQHVGAQYGLRITSLSFLPKGEDVRSANFLAEEGGRRLLIKLREGEDLPALEAAYEAVDALRVRGRLGQVVAPLRSRSGAFSSRLAAYAVAVFPFVEGISVWDAGGALDVAGWARAAELIAGLHAGSRFLTGPLLDGLPRETFANPFRDPILRALDAAELLDRTANEHQRRLQEIADYTTRILFRDSSRAEDEHAWAELQPYLPVPRGQIDAAVAAAEAAVRRVSGQWV